MRGFLAVVAWGVLLGAALAQGYASGQIVWFNYHGDWIQGMVVRQDSSGILIRHKTPEGTYDEARSFQAYYPVDQVRVDGPPAAPEPVAADSVTPGDPATQGPPPGHDGVAGGGPPRLGRYVMKVYGAGGGLQAGWFDLLPGGNYKCYTGAGGTYSFAGDTVTWHSGPFAEQFVTGKFEAQRGGKTHAIILRDRARHTRWAGYNSTD